MKNKLIDISTLIAGALTVLSFAPFDCTFMPYFTMAALLASYLHASPRRALLRGFLFGLGLFGFGISWVYISINQFGGEGVIISSVITGGFILLLSFALGVQAYLFKKLWPKNSLVSVLIAFPATWVLFEWLREWLFTGFPWLLLGTSQVDSLLSGYAPVVGTFGTSWFVVLIASLLVVAFFHHGRDRVFSICGIVFIFALSYFLNDIQWTHPVGKPIKTSLVQGNVPQSVKWEEGMIIKNIERYVKLNKKAWGSQLIVWPENSIPMPQASAIPLLDTLNQNAKKHHATLLVGLPISSPNEAYYNSMLALGETHGVYYKRHLVPFGEYVPMRSLISGLLNFFNLPMSDFVPGPVHQKLITLNSAAAPAVRLDSPVKPENDRGVSSSSLRGAKRRGNPVIKAAPPLSLQATRSNPPVTIAPFICYEIAYSNLVYQDLPKANLLITISDDAWFGHSIASWQHLEIGQMQALSTGREMLFSTNNGVTAFINAKGKIRKLAPRFKEAILTDTAQPYVGSTPWVVLGNWPIITLAFLLIILARIFRKE